MNALQARRAWGVARDELVVIEEGIRQVSSSHLGAAPPLLSALLPEAQRRVDEAFGAMLRIQREEDDRRWQEVVQAVRSFVPPDGDPMWTMDLCASGAAAPVKRRGLLTKHEASAEEAVR